MKDLSRTQFNAGVMYSSHMCFDGLEFIGGEIEWDLTFRFCVSIVSSWEVGFPFFLESWTCLWV